MVSEYETWIQTFGPRDLERKMFECDCGRNLAAQRTECGRCGAHYDTDINGDVVQIAPPIATEEA